MIAMAVNSRYLATYSQTISPSRGRMRRSRLTHLLPRSGLGYRRVNMLALQSIRFLKIRQRRSSNVSQQRIRSRTLWIARYPQKPRQWSQRHPLISRCTCRSQVRPSRPLARVSLCCNRALRITQLHSRPNSKIVTL